MDTVTLNRLHARYRDVDPDAVARLDDALADVARRALDREMDRLAAGPEFAICIREIDLAVELDVTKSSGMLAAQWARAIAGAVTGRVETARASAPPMGGRAGPTAVPGGPEGAAGEPSGPAGPAGPAGSVVVYRREVDVLVDLARSLLTGDLRRAWAWRQVGMVTGSSPTPNDLATALGHRIELLPAVLGQLRDPWALPLSVTHWRRLARAFDRSVGAAPAEDRGPWGGPHDHRAVAGAAATTDEIGPARSSVRPDRPPPTALWAALPPEDRSGLLTLLLALVDPGAIMMPAERRALALRLDRGRDPHRPARQPDSRPDPTDAAPHGPASGRFDDLDAGAAAPVPRSGDADSRPTGQRSGSEPEAEPTATLLATRFGGVLFLIQVLGLLELPRRLREATAEPAAAAHMLAQVLSRATGVPVDDHAVAVTAGIDPTDERAEPRKPTDQQQQLVAECTRTLIDWLDHRFADEPTDRRWLWERHATIERSPGWIEAGFSIDTVDLRIRRAGLDLDPGFVHWLGSVVRFRYV